MSWGTRGWKNGRVMGMEGLGVRNGVWGGRCEARELGEMWRTRGIDGRIGIHGGEMGDIVVGRCEI